jgi:hypothetical protein
MTQADLHRLVPRILGTRFDLAAVLAELAIIDDPEAALTQLRQFGLAQCSRCQRWRPTALLDPAPGPTLGVCQMCRAVSQTSPIVERIPGP